MPPQSRSGKNQRSAKTNNTNHCDEPFAAIPQQYLNSMGFIDYDKYGNFPWINGDMAEIFISRKYKRHTNFLGIDCEMVGVGDQKESALGRVSIVNEYGFCVYDEFVNPMVEITDYRTEFSGIRIEDIEEKALNLDVVLEEVAGKVKGKILVGHSIHNDLDVLNLSDHPDIRDTALYFKKLHQSNVTPSLKQLSKDYLNTDIQSGEHSSIQDAQATIKLYLLHSYQWELDLAQWPAKANIVTHNVSLTEIFNLHVQPRQSDLFVDSKSVFVRPNQVLGPYTSCEEYLDVQFRLLREDFLRPLREAVRDVQQGKINTSIQVMHSVRLKSKRSLQVNGTDCFEIKGRGTVFIPIEENNLENWEESGMFISGSLLLLSNNNFKSVKFAEVFWVKSLDERKTQNSNYLPINVFYCMDGPSWTVTDSDEFSIIESKSFYPAYRYVLQYLQVIPLNTFPMAKYVVDTITTSSAPSYLRDNIKTIDFSVVMKEGCTSKKTRPLVLGNWPKVDQLKMDVSQYEALQKALTQECTIIQGPPGTGKTYTTLQIVKMLLTNEWLCQGSPVLIVSYTNHSLDQVLELILEFVTKVVCKGNAQNAQKIILRIGGGSKSDKIEPLSLRYKEGKEKQKRNLKNLIRVHETSLKRLGGFNFKKRLLDEGILNFKKLPRLILEKLKFDQTCELLLEDDMVTNTCNWFGLEEKSLGECEPTKGLFLLRCKNLENILLGDVPKINEMVRNKLLVSEDLYLTRWARYFFLVDQLKNIMEQLEHKLPRLKKLFLDVQHYEDRSCVLKSAKIVGMTTTGAVKYKDIVVNNFKPKVMIVEEAAHVLEAHVVASLTEHCQQMILLGDHKQLRPLTGDYNLGQNYKLNVSLMERLVKNCMAQNNQNWVQLKQQHRMRPEIAKMVCPVIYEQLENHPKVKLYPNVRGCHKNIFFVHHQNPDQKEEGSCSYYNRHEARFVVYTLEYFVNYRKYKPTEITVIVAYLAHKNLLDNMLMCRPQYKDVRVSTIDGYQGEENDIILLSLVRSNVEKRVGFLKTDNRVCVALSRARHGLFMIGNMTCLKSSSDTWKQINQILEDTKCIGAQLPFNMQYHPKKAVRPIKLNKMMENLETQRKITWL